MDIFLHQTHNLVGDFKQIAFDLMQQAKLRTQGLHLFPELYLTGYPLQDLCLQRSFITAYQAMLGELTAFFSALASDEEQVYLVGGLDYVLDQNLIPQRITNVIYAFRPGMPEEILYRKMLLPNYDIFDEKKYFSPGDQVGMLTFGGLQVGLLICEDMWGDQASEVDPVRLLCDKLVQGQALDLIVNLSASPFHLNKHAARMKRAQEIGNACNVPFVYVNRVGGEDEILFDGRSFVIFAETAVVAPAFQAARLTWKMPETRIKGKSHTQLQSAQDSWQGLFSPDLAFAPTPGKPPCLSALTQQSCQELVDALCFGTLEYAQKCHMDNYLVAVSGGIDSALVLALLKVAVKNPSVIQAVYMPSKYSSDLSLTLAQDLCARLGVDLKILEIHTLHEAFQALFNQKTPNPLQGLANENIQSRIRGTVLYALANQCGGMVLNTSNKSELSVGYSTLYGDSVGALSLLGDIYKSEVFALARHINHRYGALIPEEIISRPPTAELRDGQLDVDSLPPYERLDAMLEGILSYRMTMQEMKQYGFPSEEVERVFHLYHLSEYKRKQFCPILKVKAKSFGFGYRVPICKMPLSAY